MPYSNGYKANRANGLSDVFVFTATSVHCKHCVKHCRGKLGVGLQKKLRQEGGPPKVFRLMRSGP